MTKILLVEDDKSLREIYGVRLLAEGYDIVSAGDGEEALAMAIKDRPNLIISDVMMPKISGFDMLDILRSTTETKDIRVIMMTALSSEDQRARGESLGADRYLVKSQVGIEDVVRTVHEVLGDAPVTSVPSFGAPAPAVGMRPAPTTAPAPRPVAPAAPAPVQAPAPAAQPAQVAPVPAAPTFTQPAPVPAGLPQPTAPFSTGRPANLGDRVIHPPEHTNEPANLGSLIDQELGTTPAPAASPFSQAPAPATPPVAVPAPAAPPTPFGPAPTPFDAAPQPPAPQDELPQPPQPPTFQ
jgi:CheY-like chemotaxis protein